MIDGENAQDRELPDIPTPKPAQRARSAMTGHSARSHFQVSISLKPARRGKGNKAKVSDEPQTPAERRASMTWAQRLKRVFHIDIGKCRECGAGMTVIASVEDPVVIQKILNHLMDKFEATAHTPMPESRELPAGLFS